MFLIYLMQKDTITILRGAEKQRKYLTFSIEPHKISIQIIPTQTLPEHYYCSYGSVIMIPSWEGALLWPSPADKISSRGSPALLLAADLVLPAANSAVLIPAAPRTDFVHQGLALLTLSWDKNWDSHSLVNGYPSFYPRIALVAPSPGDSISWYTREGLGRNYEEFWVSSQWSCCFYVLF